VESVLTTSGILDKIKIAPESVHHALLSNEILSKQILNTSTSNIFSSRTFKPARDIEIRDVALHPPKAKLQTVEGQARLLHDLANIELQAMELAYRTLAEFPEAPKQFREELAELTVSESKHLELCLQGINSLNFNWGDWPIHLSLWESVSPNDSLLDRILIVHRYLEGSGLDAGNAIMRRLHHVENKELRNIMTTITLDEIEHVGFGSKWYKEICKNQGLDPDHDFRERLTKLDRVLPRRLEKINRETRSKAGFTVSEIESLENFRQKQLDRVYRKSSVS
jgi:uncharacterized ferritin-like protein (DUF455 family)